MVDDALQTAALRVVARGQTFDGVEGMIRWATVVAWRAVIADWRRQARVAPVEAIDGPFDNDPAKAVEDRSSLEAVAAALSGLSDAERELILGGSKTADRRKRSRRPCACAGTERGATWPSWSKSTRPQSR